MLWRFSLSDRAACEPVREAPAASVPSLISSVWSSPMLLELYSADEGRDERLKCCPGDATALLDLAVACE